MGLHREEKGMRREEVWEWECLGRDRTGCTWGRNVEKGDMEDGGREKEEQYVVWQCGKERNSDIRLGSLWGVVGGE